MSIKMNSALRTALSDFVLHSSPFVLLCWSILAQPRAAVPQGVNQAKDEAGFVSLFNGKDLSGWHGDPKLWSVVNGEIVGSTAQTKLQHNEFLFSDKQYSDFVLRAQVKLRNHNSGIQFRSEELPEFVAAGYQCDMGEGYWGMIYEERKRGILDYWKNKPEDEKKKIQSLVKQGDWNDYEITCKGHHVKVVLNGTTTSELDDPSGATSGFFAFQLHAGPAMQASFKNVRIKELK